MERVDADVTGQPAAPGCGCCCGDDAVESGLPQAVLRSAATQLGIVDEDQQALVEALEAGDCRRTRDLMAAQVRARLGAAQRRVAASIGETAAAQAASHRGQPSDVVARHDQTVMALDRLARLQATAARLEAEPEAGGCSADCPCANSAAAAVSPLAVPHRGLVLAPTAGADSPAIACTLGGGIEAMHSRVGDWRQAIGRATGRHPVAGGVTLTYDHDERLAVELARLAAAEYACCSFFTFTLTVGPSGMDLTVTAPEQARDVVTAMFGTYGPTQAAEVARSR